VVSPGMLTEAKEAATALMVITVAVSVYGGVRNREVSKALPVFFAFAAVFSVALWASAVLGLNLMSTGNTTAYYVTVAWVGTVIILLVMTLATVIIAIIAINEIFALRSFIADMRMWTKREVGLWLPATIVRAIASDLKDMIKELSIMAFKTFVTKAVIFTEKAPKPIGPYSQAVRVGDMVFVSGQIPIDPATGKLVEGGIREQTRRVLENIKAILESAGLSLSNVTWVFVALKDLSKFSEFNEVYSEYFRESPPARITVEVSNLPGGALIEISVIAVKG